MTFTINNEIFFQTGRQIIADARKCTVASKIDDNPCQSTSNQKSLCYTDYDDIRSTPDKPTSNYLQQNCTQSDDSNRHSYTQCISQPDRQFYTNYATESNYPNKNITNTQYYEENRCNDIQEPKSYPYQEMAKNAYQEIALTQNFESNADEYQSNTNNMNYCLGQQNVGLVSNMHMTNQNWNDINTNAAEDEKDVALTLVYQQPGSREPYSCSTSYTTTPRKQYDQ